MTERPLSPELVAARTTLLRRARQQGLRARRSRVGSNERQKCIGQAQLLSACVTEIDGDKRLAKRIEKSGWDAGWRVLANRVIAYVRERDKTQREIKAAERRTG